MEKNMKLSMVVAAFAIALMLTVGIGWAQQQQGSVINKQTETCHLCEISFDGEEDEICPAISPILDDIIQGYENGNPVGWDILFPGYESSGYYIDQSQASQQTSGILFSTYVDGMDITQKEDVGVKDVESELMPSPYLTEEEIYERALELSNHCNFGDLLGDWFGSDLPGDCYDNKQAYRMAVLECFKLGAPPILGACGAALNVITASLAIGVYVVTQVAQILVGWFDIALETAMQIAQALKDVWNACIDFFYDVYCDVL